MYTPWCWAWCLAPAPGPQNVVKRAACLDRLAGAGILNPGAICVAFCMCACKTVSSLGAYSRSGAAQAIAMRGMTATFMRSQKQHQG
eukprot:1161622-Pelagomonas_calceolata.AAC.1